MSTEMVDELGELPGCQLPSKNLLRGSWNSTSVLV
jgi:hypothetical protein